MKPAAPAAIREAANAPLSLRSLGSLLRAAGVAWVDDGAASLGAALAYYTLFSMAPVLLIAISVAGAVFGVDAARSEMLGQLHVLLGRDGADAMATLLDTVQRSGQSALGTAIGLVLGVGFLLTVSLALSAALTAWGRWWAPAFGGSTAWLQSANHAFGFVFTALLFGAIYKYMPRARIGWADVVLGSLLTALLFTLGKALIGWAIGSSGVAAGFGAASAVVGLLVWVYASAQVFLYGAEVTWLFAQRHGSRRVAPAPH